VYSDLKGSLPKTIYPLGYRPEIPLSIPLIITSILFKNANIFMI
jgi:hypothetical protein